MVFRKATEKDIPAIVEMIADDELGRKREDFKIPLPTEYQKAFGKINADENQEENSEIPTVGWSIDPIYAPCGPTRSAKRSTRREPQI